MRVVGGRLRGRTIAAPPGLSTRPTTGRNRESLFNILAHREGLADRRVIDLFAGTGALGIEALSRGAAHVVFFERHPATAKVLSRNIVELGLAGQSVILRRDATRPGPCSEETGFDLVFADPPYGKGLGEAAALSLAAGGWLVPGALLVIEESREAAPEAIAGFALEDRRESGGTALSFWRFGGTGPITAK